MDFDTTATFYIWFVESFEANSSAFWLLPSLILNLAHTFAACQLQASQTLKYTVQYCAEVPSHPSFLYMLLEKWDTGRVIYLHMQIKQSLHNSNKFNSQYLV